MTKQKHLEYLTLTGKQYLINEEGYYFDYIISEIDKKYFTTIDNIKGNEIGIISYPDYEELLTNLEKIINSNTVILLLKTQKKEIELISTYFKKMDLPFNVIPLLDYLGLSNFSLKEIKEQAQTNDLFRLIYVFIKIKNIFNLNTSNLYRINKDNFETAFSKSDFKNINKEEFPNAYIYYTKAQGMFSLNIFFLLLFNDITNYSDEKISYIKKLLEAKDIANIDSKELILNEETITKYEKEIAWRKNDKKIFMIGAIGE